MPILELPPNPAPPTDPSGEGPRTERLKVRTGRYGELEEHELIHLLDAIDDERARAQFRESVYISTIFCLAITWFLFYGPRVLFHQPDYKDLITAMKEHDKQITYVELPHTPTPPAHAMPDRKTLQQLREQPRPTPPAPAEQAPQQQPAPQQATPQQQAPPRQQPAPTPPVQSPALPLPSAPRPQANQPLVDAPAPTPRIAQASPTPRDQMQDLIRGSRTGPGGAYGGAPSASGPLQAGATILTDTQGVDFTAWLRRLHNDVQRNWDPLIPEEVQPPIMKKGIVGIRFTVLADGTLSNPMILETRSGDVALDKAAWAAITSEGKFPPLPKDFHGPQIELRVGFFYNIPVQQ